MKWKNFWRGICNIANYCQFNLKPNVQLIVKGVSTQVVKMFAHYLSRLIEKNNGPLESAKQAQLKAPFIFSDIMKEFFYDFKNI